jgi:hypothetical protein
MALCLSWVQCRYIPQQTNYEMLLMKCNLEQAQLISQYIDTQMEIQK